MTRYPNESLSKGRGENRLFGFSFHRDLKPGETVASVLEFRVLDAVGQDVTTQFRPAVPPSETPTIGDHTDSAGNAYTDAQVNVRLYAATTDEQLEGSYQCYVYVLTSDGQKLEALDRHGNFPLLVVTDGLP